MDFNLNTTRYSSQHSRGRAKAKGSLSSLTTFSRAPQEASQQAYTDEEAISKEYLVDVSPGSGVRHSFGGRMDVAEAVASMKAPLQYHKRGRQRATDAANVSVATSVDGM